MKFYGEFAVDDSADQLSIVGPAGLILAGFSFPDIAVNSVESSPGELKLQATIKLQTLFDPLMGKQATAHTLLQNRQLNRGTTQSLAARLAPTAAWGESDELIYSKQTAAGAWSIRLSLDNAKAARLQQLAGYRITASQPVAFSLVIKHSLAPWIDKKLGQALPQLLQWQLLTGCEDPQTGSLLDVRDIIIMLEGIDDQAVVAALHKKLQARVSPKQFAASAQSKPSVLDSQPQTDSQRISQLIRKLRTGVSHMDTSYQQMSQLIRDLPVVYTYASQHPELQTWCHQLAEQIVAVASRLPQTVLNSRTLGDDYQLHQVEYSKTLHDIANRYPTIHAVHEKNLNLWHN